MKEPFNKDTLQMALLRAGVTPRDFELVLPCNSTTLYTYYRTGNSRRLNEYAFEQIYDFIHSALEAGNVFPINGYSDNRKAFIKRAFTFWTTHKTLAGFVSAITAEPAAPAN